MAGGRQETGIGQRGNTRGTRGVGSSVEIFCLLFYFFPSHFPFVVRTIGPIGRIPRSCTPCLRRRTHDMYVRELRIIDTYQPHKDIHDYYLKLEQTFLKRDKRIRYLGCNAGLYAGQLYVSPQILCDVGSPGSWGQSGGPLRHLHANTARW